MDTYQPIQPSLGYGIAQAFQKAGFEAQYSGTTVKIRLAVTRLGSDMHPAERNIGEGEKHTRLGNCHIKTGKSTYWEMTINAINLVGGQRTFGASGRTFHTRQEVTLRPKIDTSLQEDSEAIVAGFLNELAKLQMSAVNQATKERSNPGLNL